MTDIAIFQQNAADYIGYLLSLLPVQPEDLRKLLADVAHLTEERDRMDKVWRTAVQERDAAGDMLEAAYRAAAGGGGGASDERETTN